MIPSFHDTHIFTQKYDVHEYIQSLGLGYTWIDVGWWMQLALPLPAESQSMLKPMSYEIFGGGEKKFLVTDLVQIGTFVAKIVADERTLNQYVIIWEDELTQKEVKSIGEKYSGEEEALKAARIHVGRHDPLYRFDIISDVRVGLRR